MNIFSDNLLKPYLQNVVREKRKDFSHILYVLMVKQPETGPNLSRS